MAAQLEVIDGICDDMSIAQNLIGGSKNPPGTFSFTRTTTQSRHKLDGPENHTDSTEFTGKEWSRIAIQSSNTWSSSSGDVLSHHDDIEDRTDFLLEFNRLALKVSTYPLLRWSCIDPLLSMAYEDLFRTTTRRRA